MKTNPRAKNTRQWLEANRYNPDDLNQRGENGDTAIAKATRTGETAIVRDLIDAGVNLDLQNNDGNNRPPAKIVNLSW